MYPYPIETTSDTSSRVSAAMRRIYLKMTIGLLVTALTAWWCAATPNVAAYFITHSWSMWILLAIELVLVVSISGSITRLSATTASTLFYIFAIVNGLTLFPILYIYTGVSIAKTFFISAGVFGVMSIYGYTTRRDLSRIGSILFMALIGLFIAVIVNVFLKSPTMQWIVSIIGVLIFVGLTAWDTQQLRRMAQQMPGADTSKLATVGALNLYLDFINMFLFLLQIFGSSRD